MKKTDVAIYILWILGLSSCSLSSSQDVAGFLDSSSPEVDVRFAQSMEWNEVHGYASIAVPEDYSFYVASDSHIDSATNKLEHFIQTYRADSTRAFAVHLGDIINTPHQFNRLVEATRSSASVPSCAIRDTLFVEVGNHDLYFGQWTDYCKLFHTSVYWFETVAQTNPNKKWDLFICLDSGEGTLGSKQMQWLSTLLEQKSKEGYRHIFVLTHTHPFRHELAQGISSNYAKEESTALCGLLSKYGIDYCITGHAHYRDITTYGGVQYITVDAIQEKAADAAFLVVQSGEEITYRFVSL